MQPVQNIDFSKIFVYNILELKVTYKSFNLSWGANSGLEAEKKF